MPNQCLTVKKGTRCKKWFLRTYHNPEDIISRCIGLDHYAYIRHDRDFNDVGKPEVPHYHIILCFHNQHSLQSCENIVDKVSDLTQSDYNYHLCPIGTSSTDCLAVKYAYLTHKLCPSKTPYDPKLIVTDDKGFWDSVLMSSQKAVLREDGNEEFIKSLLVAPPLLMAKVYGRDYIKNFTAYNSFKNYILGVYDGDLDKINQQLEMEI